MCMFFGFVLPGNQKCVICLLGNQHDTAQLLIWQFFFPKISPHFCLYYLSIFFLFSFSLYLRVTLTLTLSLIIKSATHLAHICSVPLVMPENDQWNATLTQMRGGAWLNHGPPAMYPGRFSGIIDLSEDRGVEGVSGGEGRRVLMPLFLHFLCQAPHLSAVQCCREIGH